MMIVINISCNALMGNAGVILGSADSLWQSAIAAVGYPGK